MAMASTASTENMPKLAVFDLDYTLWPFWVDTHVRPPFKKQWNKIYDHVGYAIVPYRDVEDVFKKLIADGIVIGIASRTPCTSAANELIQLLDWDKYITYKEIYPGSKTTHFEKLHTKSGIPYDKMIFFDDELRNISDVSSLGVTCVLVEDGVSNEELKNGIAKFHRRS